jgi:hypothetical protein
MFDLSLAQISHPDRERDLASALDRNRLLKDSTKTQLAEAARIEAARTAPAGVRRPIAGRATTAGR